VKAIHIAKRETHTQLKTTLLSLKLTQKPPAGYWAYASLHNPLVEKVAVVDFSICLEMKLCGIREHSEY